MCRTWNPFRRAKRGRKGVTLLELITASTIGGVILAGVVSLIYMSGKTIRDIYGPTRARSIRTNVINQIHFRLADARIGSCTVSDEGHRLSFVDPNLAVGGVNVTSEFFFSADERALYYDDDISADPPANIVAKGPIEITFTLGSRALDPNRVLYLGQSAVVTLFVKTAEELSYSDVDERDGETAVYLRNL